MSIIYGADSVMPADTLLTNGYSLYDWVMRKSCFPSFWGRNITGWNRITESEKDFLRQKRCRVALIMRELSESEISQNDGTARAVEAVEAAKSLGVPQNSGIALFAYFNPEWSVNHNWMISYASYVVNNGYIPGFIGNTDSSKNFNFGRQCSHYVQATRSYSQLYAVYWSTEPKYYFDPDIWAPYAPSELLPDDMHLWNYGSIDFHSIHAEKLYARDESVMNCLWNLEEEYDSTTV